MRLDLKRLSSGWLRVGFPGGFAQVPPGFSDVEIPDRYIFQPSWNARRVNEAWRALAEMEVSDG